MNARTIEIRYVPFQMDVHTEVKVADAKGEPSIHTSFEEDSKANDFVKYCPGDYFIYDYRNDPNGKLPPTKMWVAEFRKLF